MYSNLLLLTQSKEKEREQQELNKLKQNLSFTIKKN